MDNAQINDIDQLRIKIIELEQQNELKEKRIHEKMSELEQANIFIDDLQVIISSGIQSRKNLLYVPKKYQNWMLINNKSDAIFESLMRINHRMGVKEIIVDPDYNIQEYVPKMIIEAENVLPRVNRPTEINCSLFGSFVEYFVKYSLGIREFNEVHAYLALFDFEHLPEHSRIEYGLKLPDQRARYIYNSFNKQEYMPTDICNLSFAHSLMLNNCNEDEATLLYRSIKNNEQYFVGYGDNIKSCIVLQNLSDSDQTTCDQISIGCVAGVIDVISNTNIIDIKCCSEDDLNFYRKQLFAYACLHRLRYGKFMTHCKVWNVLTGNIHTMDLSDISDEVVREHVKSMGSHCVYHTKLFDK